MFVNQVKHIARLIGMFACITKKKAKLTRKLISAIAVFTTLFLASPVWAENVKVVMYGDSLSAGYGMARQQSWPHLLAERFKANNTPIDFINESISGETTGGGLTRLSSVLERHQLDGDDWLIIELGGNDGLRGFPVKTLKINLNGMIELSQKRGVNVALMPIKIPPNYGKRYTQMMEAVYTQLSEQYGLPLVSYFMEQVATKPEFMMDDGIHPNESAQGFIRDLMLVEIKQLIAM